MEAFEEVTVTCRIVADRSTSNRNKTGVFDPSTCIQYATDHRSYLFRFEPVLLSVLSVSLSSAFGVLVFSLFEGALRGIHPRSVLCAICLRTGRLELEESVIYSRDGHGLCNTVANRFAV